MSLTPLYILKSHHSEVKRVVNGQMHLVELHRDWYTQSVLLGVMRTS